MSWQCVTIFILYQFLHRINGAYLKLFIFNHHRGLPCSTAYGGSMLVRLLSMLAHICAVFSLLEPINSHKNSYKCTREVCQHVTSTAIRLQQPSYLVKRVGIQLCMTAVVDKLASREKRNTLPICLRLLIATCALQLVTFQSQGLKNLLRLTVLDFSKN